MKKGFTLVELLAVIVILAVILVIAVPQINSVIKQTKTNSLSSTAKIIAAKAEEATVENEILENNESLSCANLVKLDENYGSCTVSMINGKGTVTIVGANKFAGITCTGTKDNMNCAESDEPEYWYSMGTLPNVPTKDYTELKIPQHPEYRAYTFIRWPGNTVNFDKDDSKDLCTLYKNKMTCFNADQSAYNENKTLVLELFGTDKCEINTYDNHEYVSCEDDIWSCGIYNEVVQCHAPSGEDNGGQCNVYFLTDYYGEVSCW